MENELGLPQIYNYHPVTGEYLSTGVADVDPLLPTNFLVPANATLRHVPILTDNQTAVFIPAVNGWIVEDDYRNAQLYSTQTGQEIKAKLGQTLEQLNATLIAPKKNESWIDGKWQIDNAKIVAVLQIAKQNALQQTQQYADDLQSTFLGTTSVLEQQRLAAKYAAAVAIKNGTPTDGDKALIQAEANLRPKFNFDQLVYVIIKHGSAAQAAMGTLNGFILLAQDAINAATTVKELNASMAALKTKADAFKAQVLGS